MSVRGGVHRVAAGVRAWLVSVAVVVPVTAVVSEPVAGRQSGSATEALGARISPESLSRRLAGWGPSALPAGSVPPQQIDSGRPIAWWAPVAVATGVTALMTLDEPIRSFIQNRRTDGLDDLGDVTARFKDREVYFIASGGALAIGLAAGKPEVTATGIRILGAYGLSAGLMIGTKWALGRGRPREEPTDPLRFRWWEGGEESAFPSGSAAVVFSLATTLADAIDYGPASIALYTGATFNAWARLNSDRHWLSDVVMGAVYGVTAAKLVSGNWTVFGLRPPELWLDGSATRVGFTVGL